MDGIEPTFSLTNYPQLSYQDRGLHSVMYRRWDSNPRCSSERQLMKLLRQPTPLTTVFICRHTRVRSEIASLSEMYPYQLDDTPIFLRDGGGARTHIGFLLLRFCRPLPKPIQPHRHWWKQRDSNPHAEDLIYSQASQPIAQYFLLQC